MRGVEGAGGLSLSPSFFFFCRGEVEGRGKVAGMRSRGEREREKFQKYLLFYGC